MNHWLDIALLAYAVGATIEGISAASQLTHSSELASPQADESDPESQPWQMWAAIATVSLCGAVLWPCRLIHRSLKAIQPTPDE